MNFLHTIAKIVAIPLITFLNFAGYQAPLQQLQAPSVTLGAFNPTGGGTYYLNSSIGTTATSIYLSSFKEPVSNISYTMTYLNTAIAYGTLDPNSQSRSEFISFTGITQNSDGTAILTGVTRGLGRSYPYTASSTLAQAHSGQSVFVLSNTPQFYTQYAVKQNNETITGSWSFPTPTSATNPATKAYADALSFGTVATATESVVGFTQLATALQQASSTLNTAAGAPLVLQARYATSTYNPSGSLQVVVTKNNNKIDDNFISTSTLLASGVVLGTTTQIGSFPAYNIGKNVQVITTTGTSTFAVPSGVTKLYVRLVGGGAGGAGGSGAQAGGGGSSGGYAEKFLDVTGTTSIQVYVGAAGNPTKFGTNGSYMQGNAGVGGSSSTRVSGGTATGGDINIQGGDGQEFGSGGSGGDGGSNPLGIGGIGARIQSLSGGDGRGYGAGSGGGYGTGGNSSGAGTATQGIIIISW